MIILVGPSASGKTEVGVRLAQAYGYKKLVTYTTRSMRVGEVDHVDYNFISVDDFKEKMDQDFFFETACYNGNFYGTAKKDIADDKYVILEPTGALKYKSSPFFVKIFYFEVPEEERIKRMGGRQDKKEDIETRIVTDRIKFDDTIKNAADAIITNYNVSIQAVAEEVHEKYQAMVKSK